MAPWHVVSWNCENLAPLLKPDSAHSLQAVHAGVGAPDVLCLQEVRLRPEDAQQLAQLSSALPGFACELALNRDRLNAKFRGGRAHGVATWFHESLGVPERLDAPWDAEGRVLCLRWPLLALALVNVYAVNGPARPYYDPVTGEVDGDRHQYKRRFFECLGEFVASIIDAN